jgi:20S proteasome alpha/beta subunit
MGYVPPRRPNPDIPFDWSPDYPPAPPLPTPDEPRPEPFRYPTRKPEPMTLVIGFRCKDGVVLVADRKITDTESAAPIWGSKIRKPMQTEPVIFGAAGEVNLFREFERKIFPQMQQSVTEYYVQNIKALTESGLSREEAMEQLSSQDVSKVARGKIPAPYVYNANAFIDDCRKLINSITGQVRGYPHGSLRVLLSIFNNGKATLHEIDPFGNEGQIEDYAAIGAGSPFVKTFFDRMYRRDFNSTDKLLRLSFLAIRFTEKIAREASVGYTKEYPPEAFQVSNNGRCEEIKIRNLNEVLDSVDEQVKAFEGSIKNAEDKIRSLSF